MEKKNQYDELLVKYLLNELNDEEEEYIAGWINESEENRLHFGEISRTWGLTAIRSINKIDVDEKWKSFIQTIGKDEVYPREDHIYKVEEDVDKANINKRRTIRRILAAASIAACIIILVGLGRQFFIKKTKAPTLANTQKNINKDSLLAVVLTELNNTTTAKKLILQDGSVIILSVKSQVKFQEPFTDNERNIVLTGKADFEVAKDKTKPFTVFSGDLSTTALGTRFSITAYTGATKISIKLYEGKVVVKQTIGALKKHQNDVYLLPGQQLVYNNLHHTVKVSLFKQNNAIAKDNSNGESVTDNDNPSVPEIGAKPWFMFNNQALPVIFEQLKELYHVDIVYSKKDVQTMYFIGKFDKSDSVATILQQIGVLNNLKVIRENKKFIIRK